MQTFQNALRTKDFTLTAELALDAGATAESIRTQARGFEPYVDALQLPESVDQEVHIAPLAAAAILLDAGIDPVMHMICRDRNRVALRADLLGAAALGVTSLLLMRGKEFPKAAKKKVSEVYDWGTRKLIRAASRMEEANFYIGSIATVFKPDRDWKPENLPVKADAGVAFVQTQPCFDIDLLRHYMARLVAERITRRISIVVGLAPLPNADIALWLSQNLRGAVVPARLIKRLRDAPDPEHEGIEICAEMLRDLTDIPGVSGANLSCLGRPEAVIEAIRRAGIGKLEPR